MNPQILGLHHMTAIASDPQRCLDFYTRTLGSRLVKLTVNFDDPSTYHLYFGDEAGNPGTILTFFPWPGARRGRVGTGMVTATALAVGSLDGWRETLTAAGVEVGDETERFGEKVLAFADPDGLPLELIETDGANFGMHSVTLTLARAEATEELLTKTMGLKFVGEENQRRRFAAGNEFVDVLTTPDAARGVSGAGTVHHVAWRTPDDSQQIAWQNQLAALGFGISPVMDRDYFHSIYFREPGGVLFEIATDPPGFAVDESPDALGTSLRLPAPYEPQRAEIERALPSLVLPGAR